MVPRGAAPAVVALLVVALLVVALLVVALLVVAPSTRSQADADRPECSGLTVGDLDHTGVTCSPRPVIETHDRASTQVAPYFDG
jgi:hypothetical protein